MAETEPVNIGDLRRDYRLESLDEANLAREPVEQFSKWLAEAITAQEIEPNAMVLATVGETGYPSARVVLLKAVTERGFVFYSDRRSRKGRELDAAPRAALNFHWPQLERQVRVVGDVEPLGDTESAAYFASRPLGSRLGAWASHQSSVIADRGVLEARLSDMAARFVGDNVPLPPHWGGYVVIPVEVEFWQGRPDRLHDRFQFTRNPESGWQRVRLSP